MIVRIPNNTYGVTHSFTVRDNDGSALNISDASSVKLRMGRKGESTPTLDGTMSFDDDGSDGIVNYDFNDGDLSTAGYYDTQIQVNYSDGKRTTNDFTIHILEVV